MYRLLLLKIYLSIIVTTDLVKAQVWKQFVWTLPTQSHTQSLCWIPFMTLCSARHNNGAFFLFIYSICVFPNQSWFNHKVTKALMEESNARTQSARCHLWHFNLTLSQATSSTGEADLDSWSIRYCRYSYGTVSGLNPERGPTCTAS